MNRPRSWPKLTAGNRSANRESIIKKLLSLFLISFPPEIFCERFVSVRRRATPAIGVMREKDRNVPCALNNLYGRAVSDRPGVARFFNLGRQLCTESQVIAGNLFLPGF